MPRFHFRTTIKGPASISVGSATSSSLTATWAAGNNAFVLSAYSLERSTDGVNWSVIYTGAALSFQDTGLTASTNYSYRVRMQDAQLHWSAYTAAASGTTSAAVSPSTRLVNLQAFQLSGSGFGSNSATLQLDDRGNPNGLLDEAWNGGHAPQSTSATYTLSNPISRAATFAPAGENVGAPHPHTIGLGVAGAHWSDTAPYQGFVTRKFTAVPTQPYSFRARWFQRCASNWSFTSGEGTNDHNLKCFFSWAPTSGGIPTEALYGGVNPAVSSNSTTITNVTLNDNNSSTMEVPDRNGHGRFWLGCPNFFGQWVMCELEMCVDSTSGPTGQGYIKLWVNGVQVVDYAGRTDGTNAAWTGATDRFLTLGPAIFVRDYGPGFTANTGAIANWWYLADARIYLAAAGVKHVGTVVAGNASTYAGSTVRSTCVWSSWSDSQIVGEFAQDLFTHGQTVYFHVLTEAGTVLDNQGSYTVGYDYYIAANGNDANNGLTPATPWSPATLGGTIVSSSAGVQTQSAQVIANQNLMKGKRTGILPGNYVPSTFCTGIGGGYGFCWQFKASGTAGAPTYLHSTTPLGALFSLSTTFDGSNFVQTTKPGDLLWFTANYVTIQGVSFNYSNTGAFIRMWDSPGSSTGDHIGIDRCSFQNVDTSTLYGSSHDNLNMIELKEAGDHQGDTITITNCYFNGCLNGDHAITDLSFNANAIGGFSYSNVIIDHNEFSGVYSAFYPKGNCGRYTFTNNYIHDSSFLMRDCNQAWTGFCSPNAAGVARSIIANNICYGVQGFSSGQGGNPAQCNVDIYNNTIAPSGASGARQMQLWLCPIGVSADSGYHLTTLMTAQTSSIYNNIFYPYATIGPALYFSKSVGAGTPYSNAFTLINYNCYTNRSGNAFSVQDLSTATTYTITSWRAAGNDINSIQSDPGFAGTPGATDPKVFKLLSTSNCKNAGRIGGTSGGAQCDQGAYGGTLAGTVGVDWRGY